MIFSEKLTLGRKSRGLSQEELAARLQVSRQAVAKWESGQSYPDISNLIELSKAFGVTVDYLVKDDACAKTPYPAQHTDEAALLRFLAEASRVTYAGGGPQGPPSRPASHDYRYQDGGYLYIDSYLGSERFVGTEAVWRDGQPVYAMNYCGRVLGEPFSGDFLKTALQNAPEDKPFRGPAVYSEGHYAYTCKLEGDLHWFQGHEEIYHQGERVYECFFHGGAVD